MIKIKNYKKVENLEEAWELNQKRTNRIIGGMLWVKMSDANVQTAMRPVRTWAGSDRRDRRGVQNRLHGHASSDGIA